MEAKKSGFAVLIGRPNVGKSTLMNRLIGMKIAITSPRPQTTRNSIRTVLTTEKGQIVFVDTPGLHKAKNRLGDYMMAAAGRALSEVDVLLWLVEPKTQISDADMAIAEKIKSVEAPVFLIINKMDTVKGPEILKVIDAWKDVLPFKEIIPVSALKEEGLTDLLGSIYRYLPEGAYFYGEDEVTDEPIKQLAAELIREKALRLLDKEIPHGIAVMMERMEKREDKDIYDVDAVIVCEKASHKGIIIGKGGKMLKQIGMNARPGIEKLLEAKVNLKLWVKVKENWRESELQVANFGYDRKEI
ncbi:MAG: GTPase Era [Lachnospiraceae bacterium]|nr:GTPase Era [Lachnospiraceae bacterium]